MSLVEHLLENGWEEDGGSYRDPESLGNKYGYVGAIGIQYRRGIEKLKRLDTALAALELAQTQLEVLIELNDQIVPDDAYRKYISDAQAALAAVRAAREGSEQ